MERRAPPLSSLHKQPVRAYLFADPVAHTLSPAMHNAAFAACVIGGLYQARQVRPAELSAALGTLRAAGVLGANLTLPHKESALPLLDSLSAAARSIGAVNTVINRDGQLHGDNTDAPGLMAALAQVGEQAEGPAVVLGAGGAARAAVWALRSTGRDVWVVNRTQAKAAALVADLGGAALALQGVDWSAVDLIVNASSAGLNAPQETPLPDLDFRRLPSSALVYDMVYKPAETRLLRQARAAGLRAENGLGMLAHQARLAFLAWLDQLGWSGQPPEIDVFLNALKSASSSSAVQVGEA